MNATMTLTDKVTAAETVKLMPDDASLEQIAEELMILAGIRKGVEDVENGRTISHEEAKRRSLSWLGK